MVVPITSTSRKAAMTDTLSAPVAKPTAVDPRSFTAVETRSIDYVPDDERHGKVSHQGPFWFVGNFQPFTLALGFVGPSMGLSLLWSIVAGIGGIASVPCSWRFTPPRDRCWDCRS